MELSDIYGAYQFVGTLFTLVVNVLMLVNLNSFLPKLQQLIDTDGTCSVLLLVGFALLIAAQHTRIRDKCFIFTLILVLVAFAMNTAAAVVFTARYLTQDQFAAIQDTHESLEIIALKAHDLLWTIMALSTALLFNEAGHITHVLLTGRIEMQDEFELMEVSRWEPRLGRPCTRSVCTLAESDAGTIVASVSSKHKEKELTEA
ncbi:hypothetical protein EIP91_001351 [Steccherinum ochraceum]|uniref:Uncharacterized protein n=1 Tax=Steccherinum ochraceum TaxID=92696 RepID=A0A4R0REC3_9APHY|nr:hypothetical protein EIP91_001351 [Steccherinum ochraceum]